MLRAAPPIGQAPVSAPLNAHNHLGVAAVGVVEQQPHRLIVGRVAARRAW